MTKNLSRRGFVAGTTAAITIGGAWTAYSHLQQIPVRQPKRKVVVLGFDGVDPRLCRDYMQKGLLPNLSALAKAGVFTELGTVNPSQSPVSWSSFAVGGDPGQHGVFDFLTRTSKDPTYFPNPESFVGQEEARFLAGIPICRPKAINKRGGKAFWDYAAEAGIKTALVLIPVTFPPPELPNGLAVSGLGVPDLCGTQATYFSLTSDKNELSPDKATEFGGMASLLTQTGNLFQGQLTGPIAPLWKQEKARRTDLLDQAKEAAHKAGLTAEQKATSDSEVKQIENDLKSFSQNPDRLSMPIEIEPGTDGQTACVRIDEDEQVVEIGEWSDWFRVHFKVTHFISVYGICKVLLHSVIPEVRIYVSPIEIDPENPVLPISHPRDYTRRLAQKTGLFKTRGWESDTAGLKEGAIDEKAFIEDTFLSMDQHTEMILDALDEDDWGLFVGVLSETDRTSHLMWRLIDPEHPMYDPDLVAKYGDTMERIYRKMDDVVGKVRAKIDLEHTDFYIISDHGFRPFRTGVNLNTWLSRNGLGGNADRPFMKLRLPATRKYQLQEVLGGSTDFFTTQVVDPDTGTTKSEYYVNWSETKAFALGLNSIFINLKGRETWGCVPKSEYAAVCDEIIQGLEGLIDPSNSRKVIHKVYRGTDIYHGPYANPDSVTFPDLVVGFEEGYRVDWQSTLGGISEEVLTPNRDKWSGDHCGIDPSLTTGILFCNGTLSIPDPKIIDFATTILDTLGVSHPPLQSRNMKVGEGVLSDSTQQEGVPGVQSWISIV